MPTVSCRRQINTQLNSLNSTLPRRSLSLQPDGNRCRLDSIAIQWQFQSGDVQSSTVSINLVHTASCPPSQRTQALFQGSSDPIFHLNVSSTTTTGTFVLPNTAFSDEPYVPHPSLLESRPAHPACLCSVTAVCVFQVFQTPEQCVSIARCNDMMQPQRVRVHPVGVPCFCCTMFPLQLCSLSARAAQ